tara:strand:- start:1107 stop:1286 length:180 start_codon:yes stop_codon:yes gene_type:complete
MKPPTMKQTITTLSLLARIYSETKDRQIFFKDEIELLGLSLCGGGESSERFDTFEINKN